MLLKLRRIAVALTAALTLAAASVPTNAEAHGFLFGPALLGAGGWGRGAWGGGGPWGGGWGGGGWGGGGW
jgi:uncharacterized membrane protein